jgi:hypothetical protein
MNKNENETCHTADYALVGEDRIDVTNWEHFGQRRVKINWPSIGEADLATAKRFAADLQAAIEIAERFSERNEA